MGGDLRLSEHILGGRSPLVEFRHNFHKTELLIECTMDVDGDGLSAASRSANAALQLSLLQDNKLLSRGFLYSQLLFLLIDIKCDELPSRKLRFATAEMILS
ncbi:hypothetical protein Y032_0162g3435 [Ancylostoma ceylanicum]|uniref:Uncharacterized protein n=1 Tax=Ancylostoma ceylanicum TaxID=53326 RepID=A0A016SY55_9BILA|nr:hypothetical protein Y032_0162g3435 [Ancylostoma ceylanicum]